jgi:hypothetical protein
VNTKQRRTLEAIFTRPTRTGIVWTDIESLLRALGAEVSEGRGSRVRVKLGGVKAVFHEPHPEKETTKGGVEAVRDFLESAGVRP